MTEITPEIRKARIKEAAARARAEAQARRDGRAQSGEAALPPEKGGRDGPEPTRFGDWEKNGLICDF